MSSNGGKVSSNGGKRLSIGGKVAKLGGKLLRVSDKLFVGWGSRDEHGQFARYSLSCYNRLISSSEEYGFS
ncbi:hypothetical protein SLU01_17460 [Sporosarcina luteola]|uniref:Uncharacterized protein n=1 Tax=Sporosarcina luteola TaxID=582850 RepID=A0A511Z7N3_9BACL|nr:hypothetical protein SLU01_17460 [Sporosarcina luteola]